MNELENNIQNLLSIVAKIQGEAKGLTDDQRQELAKEIEAATETLDEVLFSFED